MKFQNESERNKIFYKNFRIYTWYLCKTSYFCIWLSHSLYVVTEGNKSIKRTRRITSTTKTPIGQRICTRLLQSLEPHAEHGVSVLLDVLDLIAEIIVKQGRHLSAIHHIAIDRLFPYLAHDRQAVRKRAIQAIHKVSQSAASQIQADLLTRVIGALEQHEKSSELQRTILQDCGV